MQWQWYTQHNQLRTLTVRNLGFFSFLVEKIPKISGIGACWIIGRGNLLQKIFSEYDSLPPLKIAEANLTLDFTARE